MAGRFFLEHVKRFQGDVTGEMRSTGLKLLAYLDEQRKLSGVTTLSKTITLNDGSTITAAWHGNTPILTINAVGVSVAKEDIPEGIFAYITDYPGGSDVTVYDIVKGAIVGNIPAASFYNPYQTFVMGDRYHQWGKVLLRGYDKSTETRSYPTKIGKLALGPLSGIPVGRVPAANEIMSGVLDKSCGTTYYMNNGNGFSARKLGSGALVTTTTDGLELRGFGINKSKTRAYGGQWSAHAIGWYKLAGNTALYQGQFGNSGLGANPLSSPHSAIVSTPGTRLYTHSTLNSRFHIFNIENDVNTRVAFYAPGLQMTNTMRLSANEKFVVIPGNASNIFVISVENDAATLVKTITLKNPGSVANAFLPASTGVAIGPDNLIYALTQRTASASLDLYLSVYDALATSGSTPITQIRLGANSNTFLDAYGNANSAGAANLGVFGYLPSQTFPN